MRYIERLRVIGGDKAGEADSCQAAEPSPRLILAVVAIAMAAGALLSPTNSNPATAPIEIAAAAPAR